MCFSWSPAIRRGLATTTKIPYLVLPEYISTNKSYRDMVLLCIAAQKQMSLRTIAHDAPEMAGKQYSPQGHRAMFCGLCSQVTSLNESSFCIAQQPGDDGQ